jgi:hypothetical protein
MAEALQVASRTDFSGGLNAATNPYALKPNQVLRLDNLLLDEQGSLHTRDGAVTIDEGQFGTTDILALYCFRLNDTTCIELAVRRSSSGQFLNQRGGVQPWPQLGTFATQYDLPSVRTFRNMAIIAAGYEPIKYYNGTVFGSLTAGAGQVAPPGAKNIAVHRGYLWAWNTAASTTATAGPSALQMSDFNNPNSWPPEFQTFLDSGDGQQGQGLAGFTIAETGISPQGVLVAFKDFSTYTIAGIFGQPDFQIDKAKTDMGCIAPRSIEFLAGAGLMRLTHRGFALFNGTSDTLVSESIRPYLFSQRATADIQGLNWATIHRSSSAMVANPPLYLCACPVGPGPALTRVFVFDLLRQAWTILTFPYIFATLGESTMPGEQPYVLAGESGGGHVQRLFAGDATDDGTLVHWQVRLPPLKGRSPAQVLYVRRTLLKAAGMTAGQQVTARAAFGPMAQRVGPLVTTCTTRVGTPLLVSDTLEGSVEATLTHDIHRKGELLYFELEGQDHITIREMAAHVRPQAPSRPVRL